MKTPEFLCPSIGKKLYKSINTYLFDCDGVLWHSGISIPGSVDVINALHAAGKKVFYVTNNSTKTRDEYIKKCHQLGYPCAQENVVCTSHLIAEYLKSMSFSKKVYLVGSRGISQELDASGIEHIGLGPDVVEGDVFSGNLSNFCPDSDVGAVVVGFDGHISYPKMLKAATYLKNPDTIFLATNRDERFPTDTVVFPGTGTMVGCISIASGREPIVVGKPSSTLFNTLSAVHNIDPTTTLMVGDNCKTDVLMGNACGLHTLAVLTGVTSQQDIDKMKTGNWSDDDQVPEFYANSLADFLTGISMGN